MTTPPTEAQAPTPEPSEEDRKALTYTKMGSGGRCSFQQLREAVSEAKCGVREDRPPPEEFYPGHVMVEGINYNSLDRIVTAFVDEALAKARALSPMDEEDRERVAAAIRSGMVYRPEPGTGPWQLSYKQADRVLAALTRSAGRP